MSDDSLNQVLDKVIAQLPDNPVDALIDDIKRRPAPYAAVAAVGVAGALLLAARAASSDSSTAERIESQVRAALNSGLASARRTAHDGAEALKEHLPDRGPEPGIGERTRQVAASAGISQSTVAVFVGTLLTKAVTGYMRLRAEEGVRSRTPSGARVQDDDIEQRLQALNERELRTIARDRGVDDVDERDKPQLIEALARS